jgi:hypothetical protein
MPLLTLKTGSGNKSGLPTDARSRTAAHNKAVQVPSTSSSDRGEIDW